MTPTTLTHALTTVSAISLLAAFVEGIIEYAKPMIPARFTRYLPIPAAAIGLAIAFFYNADLPAALGLPSVPIAGNVITGILIGRGGNFVHDAWSRLQAGTAANLLLGQPLVGETLSTFGPPLPGAQLDGLPPGEYRLNPDASVSPLGPTTLPTAVVRGDAAIAAVAHDPAAAAAVNPDTLGDN